MLKKITALLLLFQTVALAGLPPTSLKGQSDASSTTVFGFQVPKSQFTDLTGAKGLIETGNDNVLKNPRFEGPSISNWAAYADAAGVTPVDATGGVPTATITRSTSSPLEGVASGLITKDAANRQGEGASASFTVDSADTLKYFNVSFDYSASASYVGGNTSDVRVYLYDVTNSQLIYPTGIFSEAVKTATGTYSANFALTSGTSYRLVLHIATTNASAWTFKYDNIKVGRNKVLTGAIITDWAKTTGWDIAGDSSESSVDIFERRVGDSLEIKGSFDTAAVSATAAELLIPGNRAIDLTKVSSKSNGQPVGYWNLTAAGTTNFNTDSASGQSPMFIKGNNHLYFTRSTSSGVYDVVGGNAIWGNNQTVGFFVTGIPISGWSSGITLSSASTFRISDVLVNGSRVTGSAPTALGQYRSYLRNASGYTFTETNGTPTATPSVADGLRIYGGNAFNVNDTNNQPTKYEIFIGKSKHYRVDWYSSAARTGPINVGGYSATGLDVGETVGYDPGTGILTVSSFRPTGGTSTHSGGYDVDGQNLVASPYFEVYVSENVLPVGLEPLIQNVFFSGNAGGTVNCTSSPCTMVRNSAGISSVTRTSTGIYVVNFASGIYRQTPNCTCTADVHVSNALCETEYSLSSATAMTFYLVTSTANAAVDGQATIMCTASP